jgi:TRAP transporter 4TM/12TM fusion protein
LIWALFRTLLGSFGSQDVKALKEHSFPVEQEQRRGPLGVVIAIVAIALAIFTLYMAFHVTLGPVKTRAAHLMVVIPLTFLLYPAFERLRGRAPSLIDYALALAAALAFGWAVLSADRFEERYAYYDPVELLDLILGVVAVVTIFEATRRTVGLTIVALNVIFIAYAITGPLWPGLLEHKGTSFTFLIEHLYMLSDGMFNFIMGIMATYLFTFLLFGSFLRASGGDRIFTDIAMALAGHRSGGPAKVAVISSALMGMLSGSTVSNVATTGALTIPLMKRTGFRDYEAGAIETTASVGGALTPPLMGAGVFIMAAFTGVPLVTILQYSVAPALLYFTSLYFYVHIKARKRGLKGLPREELPRLAEVLRRGAHIFLPIFVLIGLLVLKYTPFYASSACVVVVAIVSMLRAETRLTLPKLAVALEAGTRVALTVAALSASAAIIYGVITVTGLLVKVSSIILAMASGELLIAIALIAIMSYVMGMGLPVTASYVLLAALGAPALNEFGVPILAAHMVIFWFSQDSTITPPICMTAFVAARIAGAPPMRTGWESVLLAKALYVMPFMFVYGNLLDASIAQVLFDVAVLLAAFALLPVAVEGYFMDRLSMIERGLFAGAGILFVVAALGPLAEGWPWALLAGAVVAVPMVSSLRRNQKALVILKSGGES